MRIARVIGNLTLSRKHADLRPGQLIIADALDGYALQNVATTARRRKPMPESLIVYDELGAGVGQLIAVSEGAEAAAPFHPTPVPIDAYCTAILDTIEM